jgi:hypothetical protein
MQPDEDDIDAWKRPDEDDIAVWKICLQGYKDMAKPGKFVTMQYLNVISHFLFTSEKMILLQLAISKKIDLLQNMPTSNQNEIMRLLEPIRSVTQSITCETLADVLIELAIQLEECLLNQNWAPPNVALEIIAVYRKTKRRVSAEAAVKAAKTKEKPVQPGTALPGGFQDARKPDFDDQSTHRCPVCGHDNVNVNMLQDEYEAHRKEAEEKHDYAVATFNSMSKNSRPKRAPSLVVPKLKFVCHCVSKNCWGQEGGGSCRCLDENGVR